MKNLIYTLALVLGMGSTATVANSYSPSMRITITDDGFKPIEIVNLPQIIVTTIQKSYVGATIKVAAVSTNQRERSSIYQITLVNSEGIESIVLVSDKGEIIK